MTEKIIDRRRVYVGDVYLDCSDKKGIKSDKNAQKVRENVILISFGNYFVEFNKIKGRMHFNKLHKFSDFNSTPANSDDILMGTVANDGNPYFVKNVKHFFDVHHNSDLTYEDLYSLSFYASQNADCSF